MTLAKQIQVSINLRVTDLLRISTKKKASLVLRLVKQKTIDIEADDPSFTWNPFLRLSAAVGHILSRTEPTRSSL